MKPENNIQAHCPGSLRELFRTSVLALSVAGLCYYCYFLLAPWIWSRNMPFQPASITPWILVWTGERDGIEIYALYILMFVNLVIAVSLSGLTGRCAGKRTLIITTALCAIVSCIFCAAIGFTPPMNSTRETALLSVLPRSLLLMAVIFPLVAFLMYLQRRSTRWSAAAVALVLAPACFIAITPISWDDYTYIFAPALRLLTGAAVRDIYFQYELLPSLLAAIWMKLGLDLNAFQILGQTAYFIAILGVFLLSQRIFHKKELSLFLVTALILGRIYASPMDVVECFQVTPLRLDLWLPLLAMVYFRGPYHWSAGLICSLLLLLLKNFGIIYTLAYIQVLLTLFAIGYYDSDKKMSLWQQLLEYGKHCLLPVIIIAVFGGASCLLFINTEFGNFSGYYQKLGIGFTKIAANSFYWYIPALMSMTVIMLFRMRKYISATHMATGLLLTYCAIGNSIYFFGRSHEHNILNISIVLLFLLFFLLDLVARLLDKGVENRLRLQLNSSTVAAFVVLAVMVFFYSGTILYKVNVQFRNARAGQYIYPHDFSENTLLRDIKAIRQVTSNSNKVYFVSRFDFDCYYYGGFTPVGYCNPFVTWIFTKELNTFLQGLLDNGYFLVFSPDMQHLVTDVNYSSINVIGKTIVVSKMAILPLTL